MNKDTFLDLYNPRFPVATNNFENGLKTKRRDTALKMRWVQTHTEHAPNLLVLDFDDENAEWTLKGLVEEEGVIPQPNFQTLNPASNHIQAGYFIEGFAGKAKTNKFFKDIHKKLKIVSNTDYAYGNYTMRNPLHPYQVTTWGTDHLYSLSELSEYTKGVRLPSANKGAQIPSEAWGRNHGTFEALRKYAYSLYVKLKFKDDNFFEIAIYEKALELNASWAEALPLNEVRSIARSVYKWVIKNFTAEQFSKKQTYRINQRWNGQGETTAAKMLAYREAGFKIKEIAEAEGMTINAVKQALHRAKNKN